MQSACMFVQIWVRDPELNVVVVICLYYCLAAALVLWMEDTLYLAFASRIFDGVRVILWVIEQF